jgi:hypothetical protein
VSHVAAAGVATFCPTSLPWPPPRVPPALGPRVAVARRPPTVPALATRGTPQPTSTRPKHTQPIANAAGWRGRHRRDRQPRPAPAAPVWRSARPISGARRGGRLRPPRLVRGPAVQPLGQGESSRGPRWSLLARSSGPYWQAPGAPLCRGPTVSLRLPTPPSAPSVQREITGGAVAQAGLRCLPRGQPGRRRTHSPPPPPEATRRGRASPPARRARLTSRGRRDTRDGCHSRHPRRRPEKARQGLRPLDQLDRNRWFGPVGISRLALGKPTRGCGGLDRQRGVEAGGRPQATDRGHPVVDCPNRAQGLPPPIGRLGPPWPIPRLRHAPSTTRVRGRGRQVAQ